MKLSAILPVCLILAISLPGAHAQQQKPAQTPDPWMPQAADRQPPAGDTSALEKAIVNVTYTWEPWSENGKTVTFLPNGEGKNTYFPITWRAISPNELEVTIANKPEAGHIVMRFNKDFTHYFATDFDGQSDLNGHRLGSREEDTFADSGGSKEALEKAITRSTYTWEPENDSLKDIIFLPGGTGKNSFFDITWTIKGPYELEIAIAGKPEAGTIVLHFNKDYTAYRAIDFDGSHRLLGSKILNAPKYNNPATGDLKALEKALANITYTWEPQDGYAKKLTFLPNGEGKETFFPINWKVVGPYDVVVGAAGFPGEGNIYLQFNKDYTEFTSLEFNKTTRLKGYRMDPHEDDTYVANGGSQDALRQAILSAPYTWEPEADYFKKLIFLPNGDGRSNFFRVQWRVKGPYDLEVGISGQSSTITFHFNKDYTAYRSVDFDGTHKLNGHRIVRKSPWDEYLQTPPPPSH